MKTLVLLPVAAALLLACSKKDAEPAPVATPPPAPIAAPAAPAPAPEPTAAAPTLGAEAQAITAYVDGIEGEFKDKYTKKEIALTPAQLKGVTDAKWEKLHAYSDAGAVKRIKLYPAAGSTKVEEFYYRDGQLVYVSDEPTGTESQREQYFFANGQLVEAIEGDGKTATLDEAEKAKGAKLVAEAAAFLKIAGAAK